VNGDLNPQPFEEWAMSATAWATGSAAFQSPKLFSCRAGRQGCDKLIRTKQHLFLGYQVMARFNLSK
jgi:hypothetical protein